LFHTSVFFQFLLARDPCPFRGEWLWLEVCGTQSFVLSYAEEIASWEVATARSWR